MKNDLAENPSFGFGSKTSSYLILAPEWNDFRLSGVPHLRGEIVREMLCSQKKRNSYNDT